MRTIQYISPVRIGIGMIIVIGMITGAGGVVASDDCPPIGQAQPINENTTAGGDVLVQSHSQSTSESSQTYAVTARSADTIDTAQLAKYRGAGTQADARIELTISSSNVRAVQNISWVMNVRPVMRSEPAQTNVDIPGSSNGKSLWVRTESKVRLNNPYDIK